RFPASPSRKSCPAREKSPELKKESFMHEPTVSKTEMPPILVSIPQASAMIGRGRQAIYDLIGRGKIRAVKSDGRTLVVVESLREYAASLDPAKIAPPRNRRAYLHMR